MRKGRCPMILIDTNICIAYLHGDRNVTRKLLRADETDHVMIPGMVEGELFYGVEKSGRRNENREKAEQLLALIPVCHADDAVMKKFGELKAALEKKGTRVDDADVLIAATALCADATLVSGNVRHFKRFKGLRLENWFEDASTSA